LRGDLSNLHWVTHAPQQLPSLDHLVGKLVEMQGTSRPNAA
jgi:hypothetical protein